MDIATITIPDIKFKEYLIKKFDFDRDGEMSFFEAQQVKSIICCELGISSLSGIEFFQNLENLNCSKNEIVTLDLSNNSKLKSVKCTDNFKLMELNISNCTNIEYLNCIQTHLQQLNISTITNLKNLYCGNIGLENINTLKNEELEILSCRFNPIGQIDVHNNKKLKVLNVRGCKITIDIKLCNCPLLEYLDCRDNEISKLYLGSNPNLKFLNCYNNPLLHEVLIDDDQFIEKVISPIEPITEPHKKPLMRKHTGLARLLLRDITSKIRSRLSWKRDI